MANRTTGPDRTLALTLAEARGLMLAAQGLLDAPSAAPGPAQVEATVERLGAVQIDAINVLARSQYLVLWSRLGVYDAALLDAALYPGRTVFEYWSHAASILPMRDYIYYRPRMLDRKAHPWPAMREWAERNPTVVQETLALIGERGPLASADFERPADGRQASPWDWYGVKESRRALDLLWSTGELMVHSRRGIQKRFDLRERVLAEAFDGAIPADEALPSAKQRLDYLVRRTCAALGIVGPSWLRDYFRLPPLPRAGPRYAAEAALLDALVAEGALVPAVVDGLPELVYVDRARLTDLNRLRAGLAPSRTVLLSPFDSLIWDRARARALFDYEVCFEAYVLPAKRRYGYYCLSILHQGRLVGRLDPKLERDAGRLQVRALYLEPWVVVDAALLDGLAAALRDLARFLGAMNIAVERSEPAEVAPRLRERLQGA